MLLGKVLKNINKKYKSINFKNIRLNSKECKKGDIFFALKGNQLNGNNYIDEAIKKGAKIIISNLKFEGFNKNKILFIKSYNPRKLLAEASDNFYKKKPKNIIAITGTNGKTSVANFYYQILTLNKKKVAAIGTLGVLSKNFKLITNNTSIDSINIHKILQNLNKLKIQNVILEASSHGLKQDRLNNININTAIFTNFSRDHLDYHKNFKDYLNSKLILFKRLLNKKGNIIFDGEVSQYKKLNNISKIKKLKKYTFGNKNSFIKILNIEKINNKKKVSLLINNKIYSFKTSLIGNIQIKNLVFSIIAAFLSKIKIKNILNSIEKIKPISGRLEKIGNLKNNASVILDYAHTPDALETLILNIKEDFPLSKISLLFGCGGNRDKSKRPIMGSIANKYCDKIYITDDNPRTEDPKLIRTQIKKNINPNKLIEISSRSKAIFYSVNDIKSGDILIVAGKGHENYQEYRTKKIFSDKKEILRAINKKNSTLSNSIKTNILNENLKTKKINKNVLIKYASINSKKIKKNSIFIGVKGKRYDGNYYAKDAVKNGAIIAISNIKNKNQKIIFNKNPLNSFNQISKEFRKTLNANNIAITGSAGKTSVKELTSFCLNKLAKTHFSRNSYNNKFGVPISMFNAPESSKFNVLEVGMDKKGEIDSLTKLIKPDLGLITNISYAHIENFKNLNQIAEAKSEIINNITPNGTMVINMDDKFFNLILKKSQRLKLKIITYSKNNQNADVEFLNMTKKNKNYLINVKIKNQKKVFIISNNLSNYKENILATLSIIINYFDIKKIKKDLFLGFKIPNSRGSIKYFKKMSKNITIVDESYNSNPLSFKFALERFDLNYKEKNKKFLLIGNMLELGKYSLKLHQEIAKYINKSNESKTYVIGRFTRHTFNKLKPQIRGKILKNKMDIINLINKDLPKNSFLMVKGSNSTGLNKIIKTL